MDETGQPYAYTGDDPVNEVDPLGLSAELSASQQNSLAGLLEEIGSNSPIAGEPPTLANELSQLATEYGSLHGCMQVMASDPNICFATPGRSDLSQYINDGGSTCVLKQVAADEGSGQPAAAAVSVLTAFGVVVNTR